MKFNHSQVFVSLGPPTPVRSARKSLRGAWPRNLGLIGSSAEIEQVLKNIQVASRHHFSVLLQGETGTGKEVAARLIHDLSARRLQGFVPVDCGALVPTLIESEFFGHVRGAFTGADGSRIGLLEAAEGGTILLDEIGEMQLHCQAKLLRTLQEREVRPIGPRQLVRVNARVIAATNRDLEAEVKAGRFRQDPYFRLNVLKIELPPLREHKSDIPLLVDSFLAANEDLQPAIRSVSKDAMQCLLAYHWPGNVRELQHALQHALAWASGPVIEVGDLPASMHAPEGESLAEENETLSLKELERRAILHALGKTHGDKLAAARLLRIGKTTLYRKLKEYDTQALPAETSFSE